MTKTHFVTPSGLDAPNHYSTAFDMALLTRTALRNPDFAEIAATDSIKLTYGNPPYARWLSNSNKLLALYDGCIGVKTGFTDEAGRCLVSAATRDGVTLIAVTLNAPGDWSDHKKMLDYGFENVRLAETNFDIGDVSAAVVGGVSDSVPLSLARKPVCTVIDGETPDLSCRIVVPSFVYAPVETGDTVGRVEFTADGIVTDTVDLIAAEDSAIYSKKQPRALYYTIIDYLKQFV
jgi:D-alanyl-D-alanine carboxypeptidase/D-alanyl-D-alanine carboxypeptidase (penicillin-binding protein 5/6)